jgi:hypothetical protein
MIFIDNKYTRWYYNIIINAKARVLNKSVYTENHHIIPKSLGGDNSKSNLVRLTAREHFICHWLLIKMTESVNRQKMANACNLMMNYISSNQQRYKISSKIYENLKLNLSAIRRGRKNPKVSKSLTGKSLSTQHKLNVSKGRKGQKLNEISLSKIRKKYLITTPDGADLFTNNIQEFCKEYQLSLPAMRDQVAKGKQEHHKGYRIRPIQCL